MQGLTEFLQTYGTVLQLLQFLVQIVFYIAVAIAAVWAVMLFKRLVDFKTGGLVEGSDDAHTAAQVEADKFTD